MNLNVGNPLQIFGMVRQFLLGKLLQMKANPVFDGILVLQLKVDQSFLPHHRGSVVQNRSIDLGKNMQKMDFRPVVAGQTDDMSKGMSRIER